MKSKDKKLRLKPNTIIVICFIIFISFFNLLSIISTGFAGWYRKYCFSNISVLFSRITGIVSISVGEVLICLFIFLLIFMFIITVLGFFRSDVLKKYRRRYYRCMVYVMLYIYWTETFHCFIMYRTDTIEKDNFSETVKSVAARSDEENMNILVNICNHITDELNELSLQLPRDENGDLIPDYSYDECIEAMKNISDEFPLLDGYYPEPKKIYYSDIMSQQYLEGIYFPFSMEANYNTLMYSSNMPAVFCHELSHLKGYIREDEANFIAFVACIRSENDFIRYSGYLSVYNYILNDIYNYGNEEMYDKLEYINEWVDYDNIFLKEDEWEEIEDNAIVSTETLSEATDKFLDNNLKINGITSGVDNYNEVVKLIMYYYDKKIIED